MGIIKQIQLQKKDKGETGLGGFATGVAKGALSTFKGASQLGTKIGNIFLPKSLEMPDVYSEEALQKNAQQGGFLGKLFNAENLKPKSGAEKFGKFVEQVAEFAVPGSKVAKATQGAKFITKVGARAATSATVAGVQSGKVGKESAIAAGVEIGVPVVGKFIVKPVANVIKRLFTGLGGGLSGVSTDTLKAIATEPGTSRQISKEILESGQEKILLKNTKTILNGVSTIRKQASAKYGAGLEKLAATDIKPSIIARTTTEALAKNGIKVMPGKGVSLVNSEILDPKIAERAISLIDDINAQTTANGKSLRSLMQKLDSSKFKSALDPDRQAFNNLIRDLSSGLKEAINKSTDKLGKINAAYSKDLQLTEAMEDIFGGVNYKNTSEIMGISKKLETLFSQKGLAPQYIDDFLTRIGISPTKFKAGEAVRQIMTKTTGANVKGLSFGELLQQVTSAVVSPNAIKTAAIVTGYSEKVISELFKKMAPTARGTLLELLISDSSKK